VSPLLLFRRVAIAEAVTWALLLTGMFLKYATDAHQWGELAVRVFGMAHGVVFIAYCLVTLLVGIDQRWSRGRVLLGLVSAVPPFLTVWFDRYAERRGALAPSWRLVTEAPERPLERPVARLLRNPLRGALVGVVSVAVLTGVALVVGPPVG
jgi:integral membrane protein